MAGCQLSAAAMASNERLRARISSNVPKVTGMVAPSSVRSSTVTSRLALGKGSGWSNTGLIALNTAVLAPIPSARVTTAEAAQRIAHIGDERLDAVFPSGPANAFARVGRVAHLEGCGADCLIV